MKLVKCYTVVGLNYYSYYIVKDKIKVGDFLFLNKEPQNRYDKNAVSVWWGYTDGGMTQIGYIAKNEAAKLKNIYKYLYQILLLYKDNTIIVQEIENRQYTSLNPLKKFLIILKNRLTT